MMFRMMVWLSRAACVALALVVAPAVAPAQQPSQGALTAASEIIDVRGSMAVFEPVIPGVIEQAKGVFIQSNPNLAKDLNDVAADLRKQMAPRMEELRAEAAKVYASRFTEQELKEMLAFYKTPLGKKMLTEEPNVVERTLQTAQDWANRMSEEVMGKFRAEMKKKGHTL
jgi:hypothetical protein